MSVTVAETSIPIEIQLLSPVCDIPDRLSGNQHQ